MFVESSIHSSSHVFYNLSVNDNYSPSDILKMTTVHYEPDTGMKATNRAHYMSGFYLTDETYSASIDESVTFRISGGCLAIVLFYEGKCLVRDLKTDGTQSYEAGMIRSVGFEDGSWELLLSAEQKVSYLSIILSHKFLQKLTQSETWINREDIQNTVTNPDFFHKDKLVFINPEIKNILYNLLNPVYSEHNKRGYFELKLRELLFLIHIQDEQALPTNSLSPVIYDKLMAAKAYLSENYVYNTSIRELARVVSLNEFSLKTHFKALFGTTIHRFITRLRMESTARMLQEDRLVADIAEATGYQSASHFISVYKKHFGKTPKRAQLSPSTPGIV